MVIIIDVETISTAYPHICDIAWVTVNRNKIVSTKNYIVQEHLSQMAVGNFSAPKMAKTMKEITDGRAVITAWEDIAESLQVDIEKATRVYAFNSPFDRRAITNTCKALQSEHTEFFRSAEYADKWRDLWAWAANTILYKQSFIDFCNAHNLKTPKGYFSTNAETVIKFIRQEPNYIESHTALADVLDEFQIYLTIKKEIKREYDEICADEDSYAFKGSPTHTINRLDKAIVS